MKINLFNVISNDFLITCKSTRDPTVGAVFPPLPPREEPPRPLPLFCHRPLPPLGATGSGVFGLPFI